MLCATGTPLPVVNESGLVAELQSITDVHATWGFGQRHHSPPS